MVLGTRYQVAGTLRSTTEHYGALQNPPTRRYGTLRITRSRVIDYMRLPRPATEDIWDPPTPHPIYPEIRVSNRKRRSDNFCYVWGVLRPAPPPTPGFRGSATQPRWARDLGWEGLRPSKPGWAWHCPQTDWNRFWTEGGNYEKL